MKMKVNTKAVTFAESLIKQNRVQKNDEWHSAKPTPQDEDNYLATHTHEEYGKWFLGINPSANPETKEFYAFPIGNFKNIYRSGVIAAEQRAAQHQHDDIKQAARKLLDAIDQHTLPRK